MASSAQNANNVATRPNRERVRVTQDGLREEPHHGKHRATSSRRPIGVFPVDYEVVATVGMKFLVLGSDIVIAMRMFDPVGVFRWPEPGRGDNPDRGKDCHGSESGGHVHARAKLADERIGYQPADMAQGELSGE